MKRFRLRSSPAVIAKQWFKDGDHPEVSSYKNTSIPDRRCLKCNKMMQNDHGWIITRTPTHIGGLREFTVCPGDWIVMKEEAVGTYLQPPIRPEIFNNRYEPIE